jgi:hypothetical protein
MPHDKFGQELKPGDTVTLEMTVKEVYPGADFCNVSLVREMTNEQQLHLTCQAKQVTKLRPVELRATSSPDAPVGPQAFSDQ